jgi:putative phosphoribosyl transferase
MGSLNIISRSGQPFTNRVEAGKLLSRQLGHLKDRKVVVLGIPRGGIIPALELAKALHGELDVVLSHKLRTPGHPELAMGAIAEGGIAFVEPRIVQMMGIRNQMVEEEKTRQMGELNRRATEIRRVRPKVNLKDREVIITDDGVATGATTMAAVLAVRHENPHRLILALPVGSEDSLLRLAEKADETICLRVPQNFMAVGQFYTVFDQVGDEEMLDILKEARREEE